MEVGVGVGVGVGVRISKLADAVLPVFCPVTVTVWLPGWADCGTTKLVENVPLLLALDRAAATSVVSKLTSTISLCPNPLPLTCTVVPATPVVGEMVSDVPLAATDLTIQAVGRRSTTRMRAATIIWTLRVRMVDEIVEIMKRLQSSIKALLAAMAATGASRWTGTAE
jgi:hypothetical protein